MMSADRGAAAMQVRRSDHKTIALIDVRKLHNADVPPPRFHATETH
jgi:hypothetical protein